MTTAEALQLIYKTLPSVKREDIAKTHAEGEAILQTLWRTLHLAIQNNRKLNPDFTPPITAPLSGFEICKRVNNARNRPTKP